MGNLRPLLRWAGSKQRLVPALVSHSPARFNRYFEPFAGSASLFFSLQPRRATLSDINVDLVNFYRRLKASPERIYSALAGMPRGKKAYFRHRDAFNSSVDKEERAILFWYLNRHCFNGLFRTSRSGTFNVPFGSKLPRLPSAVQVKSCVRALRRASIRHADFETVIAEAYRGDFVYVDPPYSRFSLRDRGEYGLGAMSDAEISRLIAALKDADKRGVKVLVSYNCDLAELLPGWYCKVINGRHLISANPARRILINEYIACNYELAAE